MKIDSFEYVSEDDEYIKFDVTIIYPLTGFVIDEECYYNKKLKYFVGLEVDDEICLQLNSRVISFIRELKLERILSKKNISITKNL